MNRDGGIDYTMCYMKAIGIICVVAGHSFTGSALERFVGLFHMPLFFFISGYLFKEKYINNTKSYLLRKLKCLWLPTFLWIAVVVLIHNALYSIGVYSAEYPYGETIPNMYSFTDYIKALLSAFFLRCNELLFAGLWFIRMLFIACVICFFMIKYLRTKFLTFVGGVILFAVVIFSFIIEIIGYKTPYLPFFSSLFFYLGYIWRKYHSNRIQNIMLSLNMSLLYIISLVIGVNFLNCSMLNITLYKLLPYTVIALMGIFLVMNICQYLRNNPSALFLSYFSYVGNHTYDILMMHIMSFKIVTLVIIVIYGLDIKEIANFPTYLFYAKKGWFLLYLLIGINLPLVFRYCYNTLKLKITNS